MRQSPPCFWAGCHGPAPPVPGTVPPPPTRLFLGWVSWDSPLPRLFLGWVSWDSPPCSWVGCQGRGPPPCFWAGCHETVPPTRLFLGWLSWDSPLPRLFLGWLSGESPPPPTRGLEGADWLVLHWSSKILIPKPCYCPWGRCSACGPVPR